MTVKLQVLHGKLQDSRGKAAGFVKVKGPVFVIGSDPDCSMCCRSNSVSPHHCEIRLEQPEILVRDLSSESGTFVNDERVAGQRSLQAGDRLRIGRLEFTVVVEQTSAPPAGTGGRATRPARDSISDFISDLLVEEDEKERTRRLQDPSTRQFRAVATPPAQDTEAGDKSSEETTKKKVRPEKKPPGKLPAPPSVSANSSTEAAEETLNKVFFKGKR